MIKIVADSSCNLPDDLLEKHGIDVVPLSIQFGDKTYLEGVDIDREMFYRMVEETGTVPTTSQPSPAHFAEIYDRNTREGHKTLVITVTSKHSGTHDSAVLAKSLVPDAVVEVWDSLSVSLGAGFQVLEAVEAAQHGLNLSAIRMRLEDIRKRIHISLTPATLDYLRMSGRVGTLQSTLASALKLKPVIEVRSGLLEVTGKVRSRAKSIQQLIANLETNLGTGKPINLAVVHGQALEEARDLLEQITSRFQCRRVFLEEMVSSLAVHGGPGLMAVAAYRA